MTNKLSITAALKHFKNFHKGVVNIIVHIIGFIGLFYSIYKQNPLLFAISIIILESGHVYNHFRKIKKYDFRPRIILWRIIIFIVVVLLFHLINKYLL